MDRERNFPIESKESFHSQLESVWKEWKNRFPETRLNVTIEEQERLQEVLQNREAAVEQQEKEQTIFELLKDYGIETGEIREDAEGFFHLPVSSHFSDRRLPDKYGYKGGAARSLLLRALGIEKDSNPRDIDIIRIGQLYDKSFLQMDKQVAFEFMPEDASGGYGVEVVEDFKNYFQTRDFTISEVLATDSEIIVTQQCLLDTVRHILRMTDFEKRRFRNRPKMFSKILRLYAEGLVRNEPVSMQDETFEYDRTFIPPFWMALQLDRACERGTDVAEQFITILKQKGQLPIECVGVFETAEYLSSKLTEPPFYYRHASSFQFDMEERWIEENNIQERMERRSLNRLNF